MKVRKLVDFHFQYVGMHTHMCLVFDMKTGGKILARFEAPADTFLFPEPPTKRGELRTLALGKSRKYKVRDRYI